MTDRGSSFLVDGMTNFIYHNPLPQLADLFDAMARFSDRVIIGTRLRNAQRQGYIFLQNYKKKSKVNTFFSTKCAKVGMYFPAYKIYQKKERDPFIDLSISQHMNFKVRPFLKCIPSAANNQEIL